MFFFQVKNLIVEGIDALRQIADGVLSFAQSFLQAAKKLQERFAAEICKGLKRAEVGLLKLVENFKLT